MKDNQQQRYYVYTYTDPIKNEVFYIGKGTKNRAYNKNRNHLVNKRIKFLEDQGFVFKNIVNIIKYFDNEHDAYEYEKNLINQYGIKNLLNMTLGGEGVSSEVARTNACKRAKEKTLFAQTEKGRTFFSNLVKERVENGTFILVQRDENGDTVGSLNTKQRIANGTHHFLKKEHSENTSMINREKVKNKTHNFLSEVHRKTVSESNKKRISNGTLELHIKDEDGNTPAGKKMKELVKASSHHFQQHDFHIESLKKKEAYKGVCIREDMHGNTVEYISISKAIKENSNLKITSHSLRYRYLNTNEFYKGYKWYTIK